VVGINNPISQIPNTYKLEQNYPNPFNPTTNIKFGLPNAGNVKLVVFDILGREVTTLVNEYKIAGIYTVDFDASMYSSGVYFYRIESGDFSQTKKMLLIK
ncbi:MAG: T9SS type A sorting domain-containing protein, partial [Ignavibacteria bacterium]|nr:T9SS type A sorting domain-containing protein [Ignavibacteria bacterium]